MPVSADLLKALAEDPKSLEHQLGCMAGLFQIFDRQGLGRRYGSKRVSNAGSGQSQPTSACETPRHDHHHHHHLRSSNNNSADPYWMFVEDSSRFEPKNVSEPHHRTAYSDSSEIFTKSFETPTESRTEKSSQSPMYSEESSVIGGLASWDPDHAHDELKQLNVVVPVRAQQQQPATDIRDIVRASFERDHIQRAYKEKARHSVDVAAGSHGYLKNLPRSASVDGKDRSMVPDVVAAGSQQSRHPVADLPRSSSVGGRGASRMLADWKDGLRSSSGSPRLTSKERDALLKQSKNDSRDVTRLTVELKEGPRLSVSVDDRRASVDASPRPISRFRDVPVECPDFNRAADIKDFLRGEKKAGRDGHRFSVDGTRDAPRACIAPRLSVDGRDEAARKAKLVDSSFCRQSSGRKASNVVARLMGLEELPPKETTTTTSATPRFAQLEPVLYDQTFLENNHPEFSPPPPPSPPDDYDYAHHSSDHEAFQQRSIHNHFKHQQELSNCQVSTPTLQQEPSYISKELAISPPEEQAVTPTPPRNDDDDKSSRQLVRKSPQGRRSLWHIFEAMQLKGLLQGSSRRKQAEALRMHNLKMTELENEGKEQQRRSQSLPPRLNSSSSKDLHMVLDPTPTVAPAAALEIRKPSDDDDDDDCEVVIKPIITRSMSPYTKTQSATVTAPLSLPQTSIHPCGVKTDNARTYILPDEDITPKITSRAMSKSVGAYLRAVVNEQEMSGDSTYSANMRQSRKERGGAARMTKSFSDVPQSEQRDSSPRCLRGAAATTTSTTPTTPKNLQERPARSCSPRGDSSSISPRCPAGNVMENAGRMRRKAFAVKDREESKASLAHLRASATKQEFLKERASGDPDTPRLLRRSSSESKILSKMAESKPDTRARSTTPPSMSLLRSKRPVGSKSDTNKSPMKTRPTASLGLKPVPKPKERTAAKLPVPEAAPADSPKASRCEVRATQGGALDQSSDAIAREAHGRTESKAREKNVEVDEGVKTPRGVSIKKIDFSEDAQAEVAEQPSPVSVLDNSHFDEELTPSPKAGKTSVVSLQEQSLRSEKDRRWSSARFLDLDLEESASSAAAVSLKVPETAPATTTAEVEEPHRHRLRVCLQDADEESRYVEELVYASELGSGCTSPTELMTHNSYVMDPTIFDQLESKREQALVELESEKESLDRRILFDCVNEVLERLLETQLTCARWALQAPRLRKRPMGRQLVKAVFAELEDIPCAASEDVCETVYVILQKDLLNGRGQQWPDSHKELEEVSVAVERLIVKDLIEDTVRELWSPCSVAPESSRRQLFA